MSEQNGGKARDVIDETQTKMSQMMMIIIIDIQSWNIFMIHVGRYFLFQNQQLPVSCFLSQFAIKSSLRQQIAGNES